MRKVLIPEKQTPPQDWLEEARKLTKALSAAKSDDERTKLIEQHDGLLPVSWTPC